MKKTKARSLQLAACSILFFLLLSTNLASAQENDLEFSIDTSSNTVALPNIFKPNIDLSGRGFNRDATWPQQVASKEALSAWQKDIGFKGFYRIQYNFWEIEQFIKDKGLQDTLLNNYESVIKNVSDSGGTVILDIFGTPAGLGRVLDKRSFPVKTKAFKAQVKECIRRLSCEKHYNIWYEVWSAPDLDDFFLGRRQEYLILYHQIADAVKELESEYKIHIPIGGPAISWWFQNLQGNTIASPEDSLIYYLIQFCYRNHLPLDFISWHGFSSDPLAETQMTIYGEPAVKLIREWLSYFSFDKNTPLVVDEWNYDRGVNLAIDRSEDAFICSSFIPARLKGMYEAGLDYQLFFSLEDFQNNKEGVARNTGIFFFDPVSSGYKGAPKSVYNVFNMLAHLGENMFVDADKSKDEFAGIIATKDKDYISLLIYNYIDPDIVINYLSRAIGGLGGSERRALLNLIESDELNGLLRADSDINRLHLTNRTKALLKKAKELNIKAEKLKSAPRNIQLNVKNLKSNYLYQRYTVDGLCVKDCRFSPVEEKEASPGDFQEKLVLNPYSVQLIILKEKPKEVAVAKPQEDNVGAPENATAGANQTQTK